MTHGEKAAGSLRRELTSGKELRINEREREREIYFSVIWERFEATVVRCGG